MQLTWFFSCYSRDGDVLPGERGPLPRIKGVSELFDSVLLTRQAEDALLLQSVLFDELHAFLHQDWHHVRSKALLIRHNVCKTLPKHCNDRYTGTSLTGIFRKLTMHILMYIIVHVLHFHTLY